LICKEPFEAIADEGVCGRCEEQHVRRGRERIESQHDDVELEQKYVDVCLRRLEDLGQYSPKSYDAKVYERRIRESYHEGLTTEQAVDDIVKKPPGCLAGCAPIVVIGVSVAGVVALAARHLVA